MVIPAGFYLRDKACFLALMTPDFCADSLNYTDVEMHTTSRIGETKIQIACNVEPTGQQCVVVSQPKSWFAEIGLVTQPGPLLAVAVATSIRRDILASPGAAQEIVQQYNLLVHGWPAQETEPGELIAA